MHYSGYQEKKGNIFIDLKRRRDRVQKTARNSLQINLSSAILKGAGCSQGTVTRP
jgi:hypothetical protein